MRVKSTKLATGEHRKYESRNLEKEINFSLIPEAEKKPRGFIIGFGSLVEEK